PGAAVGPPGRPVVRPGEAADLPGVRRPAAAGVGPHRTPPGRGPPVSTAVLERTDPLTPAQEGMLFHSRLAPGAGVYVQQLLVTLPEAVDVAALREAWRFVAGRHAVLRTAFRLDGGE